MREKHHQHQAPRPRRRSESAHPASRVTRGGEGGANKGKSDADILEKLRSISLAEKMARQQQKVRRIILDVLLICRIAVQGFIITLHVTCKIIIVAVDAAAAATAFL